MRRKGSYNTVRFLPSAATAVTRSAAATSVSTVSRHLSVSVLIRSQYEYIVITCRECFLFVEFYNPCSRFVRTRQTNNKQVGSTNGFRSFPGLRYAKFVTMTNFFFLFRRNAKTMEGPRNGPVATKPFGDVE